MRRGENMDTSYIKNVIAQAIREVTGIKVTDENRNLFNFEWNISPVDMVYIIDRIEEDCKVDLAEIIANSGYRLLTIKNLVNAISQVK